MCGHDQILRISERPQIVQFLVSFLLLPFAWIFLVALLVLQEPLAGENSFWLTRPYSRRSLFLAKFLFILVFLNLPLFLSDCFILQMLHLAGQSRIFGLASTALVNGDHRAGICVCVRQPQRFTVFTFLAYWC